MKKFTFSLIIMLSWIGLTSSVKAGELALCDEWQQYCDNNPATSGPDTSLVAIALAKYGHCINTGSAKGTPKSEKACHEIVKAATDAWNQLHATCFKCTSPDSPYKDCPGYKEYNTPPYLACLPAIK